MTDPDAPKPIKIELPELAGALGRLDRDSNDMLKKLPNQSEAAQAYALAYANHHYAARIATRVLAMDRQGNASSAVKNPGIIVRGEDGKELVFQSSVDPEGFRANALYTLQNEGIRHYMAHFGTEPEKGRREIARLEKRTQAYMDTSRSMVCELEFESDKLEPKAGELDNILRKAGKDIPKPYNDKARQSHWREQLDDKLSAIEKESKSQSTLAELHELQGILNKTGPLPVAPLPKAVSPKKFDSLHK